MDNENPIRLEYEVRPQTGGVAWLVASVLIGLILLFALVLSYLGSYGR